MGSPDFAAPILAALNNHYNLVGVVTQPDRPAGRGRKPNPPPVKQLALELGLPVIQPENIRTDLEAKSQLQNWQADVMVVAAFGQILRQDVLSMAPFGCVNVHASLLPRWRGVSPIQAAILNGDSETGVTIMQMDAGIDTGPILYQQALPITPEDTGGSLFEKLARLGADVLIDALPKYLNGKLAATPQGESPTAYTPMLKKSDGALDFTQPAELLARQVRAYNPWPGAFTQWDGKPLKIHMAHAVGSQHHAPGERVVHANQPAIGTADGILVLDELQPAGKKAMSGEVFLRGARTWAAA